RRHPSAHYSLTPPRPPRPTLFPYTTLFRSGHHRGARIAGVADQVLEVYTGQQGQEEKQSRDARAQAPSRSKAQRTRIGDDGRLWDGCFWNWRLPLGAPQGRLPKKGGTSPACTWARNRQTIERNEVSR